MIILQNSMFICLVSCFFSSIAMAILPLMSSSQYPSSNYNTSGIGLYELAYLLNPLTIKHINLNFPDAFLWYAHKLSLFHIDHHCDTRLLLSVVSCRLPLSLKGCIVIRNLIGLITALIYRPPTFNPRPDPVCCFSTLLHRRGCMACRNGDSVQSCRIPLPIMHTSEIDCFYLSICDESCLLCVQVPHQLPVCFRGLCPGPPLEGEGRDGMKGEENGEGYVEGLRHGCWGMDVPG
jgi:hypothetical protein